MKLMMSLSCFYLLLLILFIFNTSFSDDEESAKFQSFGKTEHVSKFRPFFHAKGGSTEDKGEEDGSENVLGDQKRRIFTGPNPLHNR